MAFLTLALTAFSQPGRIKPTQLTPVKTNNSVVGYGTDTIYLRNGTAWYSAEVLPFSTVTAGIAAAQPPLYDTLRNGNVIFSADTNIYIATGFNRWTMADINGNQLIMDNSLTLDGSENGVNIRGAVILNNYGLNTSQDTTGRNAQSLSFNSSTGEIELNGISEFTGSATLDFASTAAQSSTDLTITVDGAIAGGVVTLGIPDSSVNADSSFSAWVSSVNTVTVRFNNYSNGAIDPAIGTFKVKVSNF